MGKFRVLRISESLFAVYPGSFAHRNRPRWAMQAERHVAAQPSFPRSFTPFASSSAGCESALRGKVGRSTWVESILNHVSSFFLSNSIGLLAWILMKGLVHLHRIHLSRYSAPIRLPPRA